MACAVAISTGLLGGDRGDGDARALARDRTSAPPPEGMPDGNPAQAPEPAPASAAPPPTLRAAAPQAPAARASRAAPPVRAPIPRSSGPATAGPAAPSPFRSAPPRPPALRELREGMRGPDVADMQRRLEQTGIWYAGGIDGYFGADERRALADYQRAKTITTDPSGVYGPRTRYALEAETDGP
ncbi:peptidoglycan-binding domain-containing protein [Streptomyces sp. NPDC050617]|uniref:peptidoglycan-binding domain-containing protein n=1 Tax=Streptomyces sp. NPDC050617 TaxID=3154628 RepID=UPI00342F85CE